MSEPAVAYVTEEGVTCQNCASPLVQDLADTVVVNDAYPDGFTCEECLEEVLPDPVLVVRSEWTYEDVRSLRPTLTVTQAEAVLKALSNRLLDRLTEEGNDILDNLIWFYSEQVKESE